MAKIRKTRVSRKQINQYKSGNALGEPAALGVKFVCNRTNMLQTFNWYNENKEIKNMRKFISQYSTKKFSKKIAELIDKVPDMELSMTMCTVAKLIQSGCKVTKEYSDFLDRRIKEITSKYDLVDVKETKVEKDRFSPLIADTDDMLDAFYRSNYKDDPIEYYKYLSEKGFKPGEVREAVMYYEPILEELQNEPSEITRKQKKAYEVFLKTILDDCISYLSNTRKTNKLRKPRKKKVKSADQLVSKVQFKATDPTLKISSVPPTQIVGASYVWVYNTKYARLTYLVAPDNQSLSIKGTTVQNFDEKKSLIKKIRKPEKNLSELLNMGKVAMLKAFLSLKTKPILANGRLNKETVILKVGK